MLEPEQIDSGLALIFCSLSYLEVYKSAMDIILANGCRNNHKQNLTLVVQHLEGSSGRRSYRSHFQVSSRVLNARELIEVLHDHVGSRHRIPARERVVHVSPIP